MDSNILSGGLEDIKAAKDFLVKLNDLKENNDILLSEEAKLEKNIQSKEKSISEEITSTSKKRKDEIEAVFNEQIDNLQGRIKKIRNKKEKSKSEKVAARIDIETAELREEHRQLEAEGKAIFKKFKVPSFCNTRLYYALYMPKGIGDLIIVLTALILALIVIPLSVYFYVLPDKAMIYLALVYIITVVLFFGTYMLIDSNTKEKYKEPIVKVRILRNRMAENKKKRDVIRRRILKDRDESSYGLEKFDQEVQELEGEINQITNQKKDALTVFENTTRLVIGEEIKARNQEELDALRAEYDRVCKEIKKTEANIAGLSIDITSQYEAYLGKQFMSIEKLDQLAEIMTNHNLPTVSEALAIYKQEGNKLN